MRITFSRIKNQNIFQPEFENLSMTGNASIEFKRMQVANAGMAVVYAPNGTGKSSFAHVLASENSSEEIAFQAVTDSANLTTITPENKSFTIIEDQLARHIIPGDTADYLMGADVRREYELRKSVDDGFKKAFEQDIPQKMKTDFKVSKVGDFLLAVVQENATEYYHYLRDIVNQRSRGKGIDRTAFMAFIRNPGQRVWAMQEWEFDEDKKKFVIENQKLINTIMSVDLSLVIQNEDVRLIERSDDAIWLLTKYHGLHTCVVCDNPEIDPDSLVTRKRVVRQSVYEHLSDKTKQLLENVGSDKSLKISDPFGIREIVLAFISSGCSDDFESLRHELQRYLNGIIREMCMLLLSVFDGTIMFHDYDELIALQERQPEIDEEDLIYIKDVISDNIGKEISLVRETDGSKNIKLVMEGKNLPGCPTDELCLSTGEQNFISLAFELLLAKNTERPFIVLDDPISSFDSIYKNKIAYCILKFLEKKYLIVLTHNTDLIRLLEVQLQGCFNLYILNNSESGVNGFIRVQDSEKRLLINLHDLISLFQNKDSALQPVITDVRQFLMAMVPFMRGYAHVSKDGNDDYASLSEIMHGYGTQTVNIAAIYNRLFGFEVCPVCNITSCDVIALDTENLEIINRDAYPLLADTLYQTLVYYHLRMKVEKELIDIFNIPVQGDMMLSQVIRKAFQRSDSENDEEYKKKCKFRVFFASRKTLLNEFNHFEGNMNIFQPAIDITNTALKDEVHAVNTKLAEVRVTFARS